MSSRGESGGGGPFFLLNWADGTERAASLQEIMRLVKTPRGSIELLQVYFGRSEADIALFHSDGERSTATVRLVKPINEDERFDFGEGDDDGSSGQPDNGAGMIVGEPGQRGIRLSASEIDTVLAALRLYQDWLKDPLNDMDDQAKLLDDDGIDDLCERFNAL